MPRSRCCTASCGLPSTLAESRPVLISVDDLQWADEASLRLLAYPVRRLEGVAVAVLATVRPLADEDPVLAELLADPATTFVRPSALTAPAVAELVRARLSPDADDAFCRACHRTTGGNPLLLHELVRTLATEEIEPSAASVEAVERLAPDAVARSVRLRLSRLPPEAAALARAVAVLGDGADGSHAAALAALERRTLAPAAAALARVGLLQAEPPLRFVHPLVRNAVYESIGAHERALEHARAAARPHLGGRGRGGGRRSAPAGTVAERRRRRDSASRSGRSGRRRGRSRQRRALPPTGARRANTGRRARGAAARACRRGAESRSCHDHRSPAGGRPTRRRSRAAGAGAARARPRALLGGARGGRDRRPRASPGRARPRGRPATAAAGGVRAHAGDSIRSRCGPSNGREPGCCSGCRRTTRPRAAGAASGRSSVPSWRLLR